MEKEQVATQRNYICHSSNFDQPFTGCVIKKLENSCIVEIIRWTAEDEFMVLDLLSKTVIPYTQIVKKEDE